MLLLANKSPFSILHDKDVDYSMLRVFGCLAYASTLSVQRSKFDARATPCVFMGYPPGVKGFRLYDITKKAFFISRDVMFFEHLFPFHTIQGDISPVDNNEFLNTFVLPSSPHHSSTAGYNATLEMAPSRTNGRLPTKVPLSIGPSADGSLCSRNAVLPTVSADDPNQSVISAAGDAAAPQTDETALATPNVAISAAVPDVPANISPFINADDESTTMGGQTSVIRRSNRTHKPPSYLHQYHCNLLKQIPSSSMLPYYFGNHISYDMFSPQHQNFILNVGLSYEPSFYHQAVKFHHWRMAMEEEINVMERTKTWTVVPLPAGHRAIGFKWVYRVKYKSDGSVDRYKARLVAKGYNQQEGVDYLDTFSLVAKIITVKVLLTLAKTFNWPLAQMDVNNAFLNGDLFEEVYMSLPLGYNTSITDKNLVCRLNKSIYGLKQASRQWFIKFSVALLTHGFSQTKSDYSLFTRGSGETFVALLVYVDDILLTGPSTRHIDDVKAVLKSHFLLKDLGSVKYFLGLELAHSKSGLLLSQRKYCLQILEDTGYLNAKPASTPMDPNLKLSKDVGVFLSPDDTTSYR